MRWLETTALRAIAADDGATGRHGQLFGTTRGSLSTFLLRRSWRYRLAELRVHLTNQTDVLTMKLPEGLRFLYPILRPALWGGATPPRSPKSAIARRRRGRDIGVSVAGFFKYFSQLSAWQCPFQSRSPRLV
jgi:hypothetical protein